MLNNRSLSSFKSQSFACDRFSGDYDYVTYSYLAPSLLTSRPIHRGFGRLYATSSFDRLNSCHPARRYFSDRGSSYDLAISSNVLSSSPPSTRCGSLANSTNFSWRRSDSSDALYSTTGLSSPKLNRNVFAHSSVDKVCPNQHMSIVSANDSSPIIEKRNILLNNIGRSYSPGLPPSPTLSQRPNKSRPNYAAQRSPRTTNNTFYRPPIRERPLLTSITTAIQSKHITKTKPQTTLNAAGICRFRQVIKFREHNIGYSVTDRKASINWELPVATAVSKKPEDFQSQTTSKKAVIETRKQVSGNEINTQNGCRNECEIVKVKNEELKAENKKNDESLNAQHAEYEKHENVEYSSVTDEKTERATRIDANSTHSRDSLQASKTENELKPKLRFKKYFIEEFDLIGVLGRGSFGKVFLVRLNSSDALFALKCLKKHSVIEDDDVESAMIERRMLALGSQNPFICKLFCTFQSNTHLNFVMEYLCGGDLMFHVQKCGKFSEERARFYCSEIVCALKFLHKKYIIYRDLKLDNILLDGYGHIRLVDFGMCQCRTYRQECLPSNFCGTPHYMAPEIIQGLKYNQAVDWWSFGILLYEMLVGQSPFNGTDEDELLWNVCYEKLVYPLFLSAVVKDLLTMLIERSPEKRIGSEASPHGDIANHRFFNGVNWENVNSLKIQPPFVPKIDHQTDLSNFDVEFTQLEPKLTPIDESIVAKLDNELFKGFSYTNPMLTD